MSAVSALLRGNWQDFNWHDASRGPSAIAELLVNVELSSCQLFEVSFIDRQRWDAARLERNLFECWARRQWINRSIIATARLHTEWLPTEAFHHRPIRPREHSTGHPVEVSRSILWQTRIRWTSNGRKLTIRALHWTYVDRCAFELAYT